MEKRKEVEIPKELMESDWKTNKVVVKRLTFGEQMRIRDDATKINLKGGEVKGTVNQEIAMVSTIVKGVIEAPYKIGDASIVRDLDGAFGQWVLGEVQDFNKVSEKKNES